MSTQSFWVQVKVRSGVIELRKVRGEVNPADLFTKHIPSGDRIDGLVKLFNCDYRSGRPESAPQLRRLNNDDVQAMGEQEPDVCNEFNCEMHDPSILPHHYPDDQLDNFFPKAKVDPVDDDGFPDYVADVGGAVCRGSAVIMTMGAMECLLSFPWARGSYRFWFLCSLRFCEQVPVGFCDHDVVYVECCAADALALRSGCGGGAAAES